MALLALSYRASLSHQMTVQILHCLLFSTRSGGSMHHVGYAAATSLLHNNCWPVQGARHWRLMI
jgi:hypothetical protein